MDIGLTDKFNELNHSLIDHYQCFNTERFWLDDMEKDYISIVTSISDTCPVKLCKNIAKFTYKTAKRMKLNPKFIYVGAWAIDTSKL